MTFSQKRLDFLDWIIKSFYDNHPDEFTVSKYNKYAGSCVVEYDDAEFSLGRRKVDNAITEIITDIRIDYDMDSEKSIFYANKYNEKSLEDEDIYAIIQIALFGEMID